MSSPGASPGVSWRRPNRWGYRSSMRTVCSNSSRRHDPHRGPGRQKIRSKPSVSRVRWISISAAPSFSGISPAITPTGRSLRAAVPARPCQKAASRAASTGASPWERNVAIIPVRTSPVPAVASAGSPLVLTWISVPSSISVTWPFKSVVIPYCATKARRRSTRASPVQPGELAGVRREDGAFAAQQTQILAEMMECARVRDDREIRRAHDAADDLAHLGGEREAGADPDRAATARRLEDLLDRLRRLVFVVRDDDLLDEMSA